MAAQGIRRSDRISVEIPIEVTGSNSKGIAFVEETRTQVVSRHGAAIMLKHLLVRDQEIAIRNAANSKDGDARIIGLLKELSEGYSYGIELLDPELNLWEIDFPPLTESERAVARVVVECVRCHARELVYLDALEAEVLEASRSLSRPCKRCTDTSIWKLSRETAADPAPAASLTAVPTPTPPQLAPTKSERTENRRKHFRVGVKMTVGIRHDFFGLEIATTENVSRGGFGFKSPQPYVVGTMISAAVPYVAGGANVFVPARIAHARRLANEGVFFYGAAYIPAHKGWPGK